MHRSCHIRCKPNMTDLDLEREALRRLQTLFTALKRPGKQVNGEMCCVGTFSQILSTTTSRQLPGLYTSYTSSCFLSSCYRQMWTITGIFFKTFSFSSAGNFKCGRQPAELELTLTTAAGSQSLPVIKSGWGSEVKGERWETDAVLTRSKGRKERQREALFTSECESSNWMEGEGTDGRIYGGMAGISWMVMTETGGTAVERLALLPHS